MRTKRFLYALLNILILLPLLTVSVFAHSYTVVDKCLTVSDNKNNSSYSNGIVTVTGKGGFTSGTTNTVTITNIGSTKANITFDFQVEKPADGYQTNISDNPSSGTANIDLAPTGTHTMTITGGGLLTGEGVLKLSNFTYTPIIEGSATITHNNLGSVTVDGVSFTSGNTTGTLGDAGAKLVATPNSGASFVAWVKAGTNEVLSQEESFTLKPYASAMSIQAVFTTATSPAYYMTNSILYNDPNTAVTAANSGDKKVVVVSDGTMPTGTINIPTGITFLVPYSSSDYDIDTETKTVEGGMKSTLEHANKKLVISNRDDMLMPQNKVTYTLTIPSGTTVNVASGGRFVIGGTICCGHDSYIGIIGGTAGDHSNVQLEGTLNVSGILSSCGYILGNGQINVANGGAVYQPFVAMDQRNGQYVVGTTTGDDNIFPWNRYALMNIQCNVAMVQGASMKGYIDAYTAAVLIFPERHTVACQTIIGPSGALFNVAGGSVDISYDPDKHVNDVDYTTGNAQYGKGLYDRVGTTTIAFNGDVSIGNLTLKVSVAGSDRTVNSNSDYFPIPYNLQIHQNSGTFTVSQKLKLLPGALLHIHENAALNVTNNLAVMDGFSDQCDVSQATMSADKYARYRYPVAADLMAAGFCGTAQLIVDGTMTVASTGAFGGVVQTSGSGTVTMSGTPGLTVTAGPRSQVTVAMTTANISGRTVYELTPRLFIPGENKTLEMKKGKTYVALDGAGHTIASFDYTLHTTANNNSATVKVPGRELKAGVIGTWAQAVAKIKTTSGAYLKDTSNNDIFLPLTKAIDTYKNSSNVSHIEMVDNSTDAVTISDPVTIDLRGKNLSGITINAATKFMDTATNDYETPGGQLTVSDSKNIASVVPHTLTDSLTKRYYVKSYDKATGSYSFPRVAAAVSGVQFVLDPNGTENKSYLILEGTFRGNSAAVTALDDMGFTVSGSESWMLKSDSNKTLPNADGGAVHYGYALNKLSDLTTSIQALLQFDGEEVPSADKLSVIKSALENLSAEGLTERQAAALKAFQGKS